MGLLVQDERGRLQLGRLHERTGRPAGWLGDYFGNNAATIPSQISIDDLGLSSSGIGGAAHPVVPSNNVIDANHLDGSTDLGGYPTAKGADDVIGVDQESGDAFANNRIDNAYDCGIELGNLFQGGTITNNVFSNDWAAGICSTTSRAGSTTSCPATR